MFCNCFLSQVQLLVSKKEKDNYLKIRNYLEDLKGLVDEAELWVLKSEAIQQKVYYHNYVAWSKLLVTCSPVHVHACRKIILKKLLIHVHLIKIFVLFFFPNFLLFIDIHVHVHVPAFFPCSRRNWFVNQVKPVLMLRWRHPLLHLSVTYRRTPRRKADWYGDNIRVQYMWKCTCTKL